MDADRKQEKSFGGVFYGDNHTVSGVYVNSSSDNQGFFGYIDGVKVYDIRIEESYIKGGYSVAGVVAYNYNGSTVSGCSHNGTVIGEKRVGGVVGYSYYG